MIYLRTDNRGFTLVEIILTLIIASVVGTMIFQVFGTSFIKSTVPVQRVQQAFDLQQAMENITADYESGTGLVVLEARISAGDYGSYTPTTTYGDFNGTTWEDTASYSSGVLLKVKIYTDSGELMTLFPDK